MEFLKECWAGDIPESKIPPCRANDQFVSVPHVCNVSVPRLTASLRCSKIFLLILDLVTFLDVKEVCIETTKDSLLKMRQFV